MKRTYILAALVAAAGIAAASAITVTQRTDTSSILAERFSLPQQFALDASTLAPAPAALGAAGTQGAPVELSAALPAARTAIARDHWVYAVAVKETQPVAGGTFSLRLFVDNVPVGEVFVAQGSVDAATEGVLASFDLGASLSSDALYYVEVRPVVATGPTVSFTLRSNPNANLTWLGLGGAIDGIVNPDLPVALGSTVRLTARSADGALHNIGIRSGSTLVDPPGWSGNVESAADEATIAWTPGSTGTYSYRCQYHAGMTGTLRVA